MIELECKTDECEETLMCDEGVVAVTCASCVNNLIINMNQFTSHQGVIPLISPREKYGMGRPGKQKNERGAHT